MHAIPHIGLSRISQRGILLALILLIVVVIALTLALASTSATGLDFFENAPTYIPEASSLSQAPAYDLEARPITLLEPGTVIRPPEAPEGWSHLIVKTNLVVADGDTLNKGIAEAIGLFFTAYAAHIEQLSDNKWRLAKLAVGSGMRTRDGDRIISSNCGKSAQPLSYLVSKVLRQHEAHFATVRIRARSETMAIIDDPTWMNCDGRHCPVVIRYSLLLDPAIGDLQTLVWRIDGDESSGYRSAVGPIERLAAGCHDECCLHVDGRECLLGMPLKSSALAILHLPRGKARHEMPHALRDNAGRLRFTAAQAAELETSLRDVLKSD